MIRTLWRRTLVAAVAALMLGGLANVGSSQEPTPSDLVRRLDALEKQNRELQQKLQQMATPVNTESGAVDARSVENIVSNYLQRQADAKKAEDKGNADEGYKIGTDLKMSASWKNGFTAETPNKDFTMHIGGWIQWDNVWWNQTFALRKAQDGLPKGVASGVGTGGIGDLQDGTYFRRERIMMDGNFWENYEYTLIYAFENDQQLQAGLDEFWVGAKNVPILGTVRLGHVKNCIGLEGDMTASSRCMTFMERSAYSEAVELNQNFVTGVWMGNNYNDQRFTWSGVFFRPDTGSSTGAFFGDGQWGAQGRLTALPLYENDGRCLMHVGLSGGWRNGVVTGGFHTFRERARPELRDDVPPGGAPGGNSTRMVDSNTIDADREFLAGLEFLYIRGPFSVQAEYGGNWVDGVQGYNGVKVKNAPNYVGQGGYVQLAYTLTGENRSYDKRLGRLDSYYFGRKGLYNNAWFVRGDDGNINWSLGAWEVAARWSYLDLNSGSGKTEVQGGKMDGLSLGLNWYLNDSLKFQFEWIYDHRYNLPAGAIPGWTGGLGIRMQYMF